MTAANLRIYFKELYNLSSHTNDSKEDDEIDIYLNIAQDEIIEENVIEVEGALEFRKIKNSIKSFNILQPLITTSSDVLDSYNANYYNVYNLTGLPSNIRYLIGGQAKKATRLDSTLNHPVKLISPVEMHKYIHTSENRPVIPNPIVTILNGTIICIVDPDDRSSGLDEFKIEYIKEPATITGSTTCELGTACHIDLVKRAVNIALKSSSMEPAQKVNFDIQEGVQ